MRAVPGSRASLRCPGDHARAGLAIEIAPRERRCLQRARRPRSTRSASGSDARSPWAAEVSGFNVHAGVTVRAGDREGFEKLCRYGARPPFSLERLALLPDGRIAYRLRRPRRNGATHLVLEPIAFMARLAAVIPPPRYPLLRLSGVLAPHASWRAAVVSRVPAASATRSSPKPPKSKPTMPGSGAAVAVSVERDGAPLAPPSEASAPDAQSGPRTRLGTGVTKPVGARIDWARLLRRVYREDVLACPCGGRRRRASTGRACSVGCTLRTCWPARVAGGGGSWPTSPSARSSSPASSISGSRARRLPSRVRGARTAKRRERRRRSPLSPATPASTPTCAAALPAHRFAANALGRAAPPTRGAPTTGHWAVEGAFDVLASRRPSTARRPGERVEPLRIDRLAAKPCSTPRAHASVAFRRHAPS
ncbi:transposase [Sorangium sp. So ce281]|uniref:transposase n=1 Tax=Sorangium sp. So ce281 TaxID=3133293 RepID=UPI003F5E449E